MQDFWPIHIGCISFLEWVRWICLDSLLPPTVSWQSWRHPETIRKFHRLVICRRCFFFNRIWGCTRLVNGHQRSKTSETKKTHAHIIFHKIWMKPPKVDLTTQISVYRHMNYELKDSANCFCLRITSYVCLDVYQQKPRQHKLWPRCCSHHGRGCPSWTAPPGPYVGSVGGQVLCLYSKVSAFKRLYEWESEWDNMMNL